MGIKKFFTKFFTKEEVRDIIISVLAITFIFSYPQLDLFFFYLIVIVIVFVFHEMAHKFTAIKFHCAASYEMWPAGLLTSLIFMALGVKILVPGAVVIRPYKFGRWGFRTARLTIPEMGIISLSGPAVNLFFALIFSLVPGFFAGLISQVNAWLAFFNMLPIPPLDGSKVIRWKIWVWFLFILTAGFLMLRFFA
jgi:Zn-dependent protease